MSAAGFAGPFCVADARPVHAAGGGEAQELAFAIASALAYLRALEGAGLSLDVARKAISFRIAVDADEFLGVAKLRALRRLWARVEDACGLAPAPALVHAETAWRMMTRRDPYVNMLRTTVATFSAAVGGADRITVLPFTQAIGLPDDFARRAARNTQLVLLEESNLDKVADPTAGAGGFETLTEDFCDKAWALVQQAEKAGGLAAQIESGALKTDVEKAAAERAKNVARRKDALTGASEFPNIAEQPATVLAPIPTQPRDIGGRAPSASSGRTIRGAARQVRCARRQAASAPPCSSPISARLRPSPRARPSPRISSRPAASRRRPTTVSLTPEAAAEAYAASGAPIACICSSDAVYAEQAEAVAKALKSKGAKRVVLAGRAGDKEADYRSAGIGDFVFAGGDVLAALERAWRAIA